MTKPPLQRPPQRGLAETRPTRPALPPPRRSLRDSLKIVPMASREASGQQELPEWEAFAEPPETEVTGSRSAVHANGPNTDEFAPMAPYAPADSNFDAYRPTQVLPELTPNPSPQSERPDLVRAPVLEGTAAPRDFAEEFDRTEMTQFGVALADADERELEEEARKKEIEALLRAYLQK